MDEQDVFPSDDEIIEEDPLSASELEGSEPTVSELGDPDNVKQFGDVRRKGVLTEKELETAIKLLEERAQALEESGDLFYRITPGEGRLMEIGFENILAPDATPAFQQKVYKFFDELYNKYGGYLAQSINDTRNFSSSKAGPSFQVTIVNSKIIYQDFLAIDEIAQGNKHGTAMGLEVLKFAKDNGLYVVATPVNWKVRQGMMNSGFATPIGSNLLVYGLPEDVPDFVNEMISQYNNGLFDIMQNDLWAISYYELLQNFNELTASEKQELQQRMKNNTKYYNNAFHDRNKANPDTTRLLKALYKGTPASEIDWSKYRIFTSLEPLDELLLYMDNDEYTMEKKYLSGDIANEGFSEISRYSDLTNTAHQGTFRQWLTGTTEGTTLLGGLFNHLENKGRTIADFDFDKIVRLLGNNSLVQEHLRLSNTDNVNKNIDRLNNAGRTNRAYYGYDFWKGDYDELDKKLLEDLYNPNFRKRIIEKLRDSFAGVTNMMPIHDYFGIFADIQPFTPGIFPKLDLSDDSTLTVYRAASPIDAALGLRNPTWKPDGGRTAGFGSNNYFATSINYTQDYRVFNRPTYAYEIDISDVRPNDILDFTRTLDGYSRHRLFDSMVDNDLLDKLTYKLMEMVDNPTVGEYNYKYKTFGAAYQSAISDGWRATNNLPHLIDALKDGGFFAIVHQWTGRPGNTYKSYSAGNSIERIHPDSRTRLQEEILFLNPEQLKYSISEVPNTRGATGKDFGVVDKSQLKPFNPAEAIIDDFSSIFKYQSELHPSVHSTISRLRKELRDEIANRKDIIEKVLPKEEQDKLFNALDNISNLVTEELANAEQAGRAALSENVYSKILSEGIDNLTIKKELDVNNYRIPLIDVQQGDKVVKHINAKQGLTSFVMSSGNESSYLKRKITLPNGSTWNAVYKILVDEGNLNYKVIGPYGVETIKLDDTFSAIDTGNVTPDTGIPTDIIELSEGKLPPAYDNVYMVGADGEGTTRYLNDTLQHLINNPIDMTVEINLFHVSPDGPLSINDVRAGIFKNNYPASDKYGELEWVKLDNFLDERNLKASVGISLALDKDFVNDNYRTIVGRKGDDLPNKTLNAYKARINMQSITSIENLHSGSWLNSFDINGAANALGLEYNDLLSLMRKHGLVTVEGLNLVGQPIMWADGNLNGLAKMFDFANNLQQFPHLRTFNENAINMKFLRGGGIEGYIVSPNVYHEDFTEFVLLDPNDQIGLGKHVDIIDVDANYVNSEYKLIPNDTEPLRTRNDITIMSNEEVLDNAFEQRERFNRGFRTVQDEALGLTGDVPELVSESIFDDDTVRAVVNHGNNLDNETVKNARDIIISNIEEPLRLTQEQATQQMIDAIKAGKFVDIHNLTKKQFLIEKANARLARSIATRGVMSTGFLLLDIYELSVLGAAALYGTNDYWTKYLSDGINDITNGVLGTDYDMSTVEVDMDKYIKSLETADKASPFSYLYKSITDKPLIKTLGQFDMLYGEPELAINTGPKPPGLIGYGLSSIVAGISPGVTTEDLTGIPADITLSEYGELRRGPSFDDIVNMETNPGYNFIGPVRNLADYPTQTGPTIRQSTPEETNYANASPFGRIWQTYKKNFREYHNNKILEKTETTPFWTNNSYKIQDTETQGLYGRMLDNYIEENY